RTRDVREAPRGGLIHGVVRRASAGCEQPVHEGAAEACHLCAILRKPRPFRRCRNEKLARCFCSRWSFPSDGAPILRENSAQMSDFHGSCEMRCLRDGNETRSIAVFRPAMHFQRMNRRSNWTQTIAGVFGMAVLMLASASFAPRTTLGAAQLSDRTARAFDKYIHDAEMRSEEDLAATKGFLWIDAMPIARG